MQQQQQTFSIGLLSDDALQLVAASYGLLGADAHKSRPQLVDQIQQAMKASLTSSFSFSNSSPAPLPIACFGFSVATHHGKLYAFGGRPSEEAPTSSNLFCFDTAKAHEAWQLCSQHGQPPAPRRWHSASVYDGAMFIYGGQEYAAGAWEPTGSISKFTFSTRSWSEVQQAGCGPSARLSKRAATIAGSCLYVLPTGAPAGPQSFSVLHCFDLSICCWSMRVCSGPDMPDPATHGLLDQLLHWQGCLLAVFSPAAPAAQQPSPGAAAASPSQQQVAAPASAKSLSVFSLSLVSNQWRRIATAGTAPCSRTQSCVTLLDELLIVSGGSRGPSQPLLADLHCLNMRTRRWTQLQPPGHLHPARAGHAGAVISDTVWLVGGWHSDWPSSAAGFWMQRRFHQEPSAGAAAESSRSVVNTELLAGLRRSATGSSSSGSGGGGGFSHDMPHCDVTLISEEGQQFRAHKFILSAQSAVFTAMLSQSADFAEAASNSITLPDVRTQVLDALLSYLYSGLPGGIDRGLVLELFTAADRFMLPGLAAECVLLLLRCLTAENVSLVADLANTHRLLELWQACVGFAAEPEVQVEVFDSTAYMQLWRENALVAKAFTNQVVRATQQLVMQMKQQLPAAAAGMAPGCAGQQALGVPPAMQDEEANKRHRPA